MVEEIFIMLDTMKNKYSFQEFACGFCNEANFNDIFAENFDSFLAWCIYVTELNDLDPKKREIVINLRKLAAEKFKFTWKEGYNPNVTHAKFNLEDVKYIHRPLLLYILVKLVNIIYNARYFWFTGFERHTLKGGTSFWIREDKFSTKLPIVIFHGICSGWFYYAEMATLLSSDRTIILYDFDPVNLNSMVFDVPTASEVNDDLDQILKKFFIKKICLVAHSWGTFLSNWIIRMSPHLIEHLTLIDPISLTVVLPETTYTILYKPPDVLADYLLYYFVRHDLTISNILHRNFAWFNVALSFADIPNNIGVTIGISAKDELISYKAINELTDHYARIRKSLKSKNNESVAHIKKVVWSDLKHGESITNMNCIKEIQELIPDYEKDIDHIIFIEKKE
jgi:pimeloyl-ACP methyl ester carboxylesterase